MKTVYTIKELRRLQAEHKGATIGFVPTMGYLHEGHLSLAEAAREDNEIVIMSIFVNPLQFGPNEDFDRYPRDEEADRAKAAQAGVDILFIPSVQEIYPVPMKMSLTFTEGADVLCGRSRPGHFDGVATVLTKLFNIVQADNAYFGLKDAQQFALVHTLIQQFNFPINLIGLPTVRDADGLAKSSRNVYLSEAERKEAKHLHECLESGRHAIQQGETNSQFIKELVSKRMSEKLMNARVEYVELLTYPALHASDVVQEQAILAIAAQYSKARLIDNLIVLPNGQKRDKIIIEHN